MFTARRQRAAHRAAMQRARAEIGQIRDNLESAYSCFNSLSDPLLVDACIYEINALRVRYDHALRRAKESLL